jgi:hypothetical protein
MNNYQEQIEQARADFETATSKQARRDAVRRVCLLTIALCEAEAEQGNAKAFLAEAESQRKKLAQLEEDWAASDKRAAERNK